MDHLIANRRAPPMLDDLVKSVDEATARSTQSRIYSGMGNGGFIGVIKQAGESPECKVDPQFRKAGLTLLMDKLNGKITGEQFLEGCNSMDELAKLMNPEEERRKYTRGIGHPGTDRRLNERE